MGIDHVLNRVGNDITAGQAVEHAVMSHGNTVVDGDGIELCGIAAHSLDFLTDNLSYLVQMSMTWNKLGKRVDNGDDRFTELLVFHTCGNP